MKSDQPPNSQKSSQTYALHPLLLSLTQGATPSFDEICADLRFSIPLLDHLKTTPQDSKWHREGDVYTHSRMALDALYTEIHLHEQNAPLLLP